MTLNELEEYSGGLKPAACQRLHFLESINDCLTIGTGAFKPFLGHGIPKGFQLVFQLPRSGLQLSYRFRQGP